MFITIFKGLKGNWAKVGDYLLFKVCNVVCINTWIGDDFKFKSYFENGFFFF